MSLGAIYESYFGCRASILWVLVTIAAGAMPLGYVTERHWLTA